MSNCRMTVENTGLCRYQYDIGEDMSFRFHLLSEVGEPYQPWFRKTIAEQGFVIETRELDCYPWVADFVVKD